MPGNQFLFDRWKSLRQIANQIGEGFQHEPSKLRQGRSLTLRKLSHDAPSG